MAVTDNRLHLFWTDTVLHKLVTDWKCILVTCEKHCITRRLLCNFVMATAMASPGSAGSENFQSSDQQTGSGNVNNEPKTSVSNGPASPDVGTTQKDNKKPEETVKKFDNINFVEAPIPKTNPWNKGKNITNHSGLESGEKKPKEAQCL